MRDWICARRSCWSADRSPLGALVRPLEKLSGVTGRVAAQRWVRYRIDLARVPPAPDDVVLTPLSPAAIALLHNHPDCSQEAFASGLEFWDFGVREGFVWLDEGQPLCFQWLLSAHDTATLRARSPWANMYPPIDEGTGQLEKLWTFSTARKKGVASRFALAMFAEARRRGYHTLVTHIHESNEAARSWALKTGWNAYGMIERFTFDVPLLRSMNLSVCAHRRNKEPAHAG